MLSLVQRGKKLVFVGVPALVSVLWMMSLSDHFRIGSMAIKSGIFVFVAVLVPVVLVHTVVLVVIERKLDRAVKAARVPRATARDKRE